MIKHSLLFCFFLCSTILQAKNIIVTNASELNAANETAKPGDTVLLKNGNWQNLDMVLTCNGNAKQPIVFKAQTNGQVFIKGKSRLRLGGSYIIVEGLLFTDGFASNGSVWEFRKRKQVGNNCRITNCMINGFNNINRKDENYWVAFYGKNNRVDHCNFINKTNLGVL
ncbi:MAG TPA: chondroitinase-B domain-containing protein, partial [Ferruginibacter sp.]|nr:chondroitinase-B domain-containing protein [Ferruginibacter sp.]